MRNPVRFSLRSLLLAVTLWSVLLAGFVRWGLVEALELVMLIIGLLVLGAHLHREVFRERRRGSVALALIYVAATIEAVVVACLTTRFELGWVAVGAWSFAAVLMFPLALIHHGLCRYCGWHSALAQPGTFFLVVVLNMLLWVHLGRWLRRRTAGADASGDGGPPVREEVRDSGG